MGHRLLIVDDSNIVRRSLKKCIDMASVDVEQVYEAENGQVALELLGKKWVDLVFLDINMPVMNGMEFMRRMREERKFDAIPVIVISTEGSQDRKHELFEKNITAYLRKPITPEELTVAIRNSLGEN